MPTQKTSRVIARYTLCGFLLCTLLVGAFLKIKTQKSPIAGHNPPSIAACAEKPAYLKVTCVSDIYSKALADTPAKTLLAEASRLQSAQEIPDCHSVAHSIGNTLLTVERGDVGKAFIACTHACVDGCFHGVMETKVNQNLQNTIDLTALLRDSCETFSDPVLHRQCVHGIGHGLASHDALPLGQALDTCMQARTQADAESCSNGVLMEHASSFLYGKNDEDLRAAVPLICAEAAKLDAAGKPGLLDGCAASVGQGLMLYAGDNLEKSLKLCSLLKGSNAEICAESARQEDQDHKNDIGRDGR